MSSSNKKLHEAARMLGKLGAAARNARLSAERRQEIARIGGKAGGRGRGKQAPAVSIKGDGSE